MNSDLIRYSTRNLGKRRLRSFLSTLSILIGIMAIYALISFGQGLSKYIDDISESMGTDKIIIQAKGFGAPGTSNVQFTEDDVRFIRRVKGVKEVVPLAFDSLKVQFKGSEIRYVWGVSHPTDSSMDLFLEGFGVDIFRGRQLKKGDVTKVVLGYNYQEPNRVFKRPIQLGDRIEINGIQMDVVGFYNKVGNPEDDRNVYMSFEGLELVTGQKINYAQIFAQAERAQDPVVLAERVKERLRRHRGQAKGQEDFHVQTYEQLIESFNNIINGLNLVLVVIALISVLVAAVNIANTMYTAVLERTKEIGVLKAIGARNNAVLFIFVFESGVLGLLGGAAGILLGFAVAKMGGLIAVNAGYDMLQPYFPYWLTLGSMLFAFLVGALSGLSPAIQASRQKPVDALRYE